MKLSISLSALLIVGFVVASSEPASAVIYCQYISYPAGCIVRPGVVLVARPVARAVVTPGVGAPGVGVRVGTPMNRGGPVNRVGVTASVNVASLQRTRRGNLRFRS